MSAHDDTFLLTAFLVGLAVPFAAFVSSMLLVQPETIRQWIAVCSVEPIGALIVGLGFLAWQKRRTGRA